MKRNESVELYRVISMLGICIFHGSIIKGHSAQAWWINLWPWCVNAFVFISGYFGLTFKPSKVVRMYGVIISSVIIVALYRSFEGSFALERLPVAIWPTVKNFWFLHAYVFLMVLAPVVDAAVERGGVKIVVPIMLMVFGWSFSKTLPCVGRFVPNTPGLESYSGMSLLATYAFARIYRVCNCEHKWKKVNVLLAFVLLLVLSSLGLCEYDSPVATGLACCGFYFVSKLELSRNLCRIVSVLAPSMFSVYAISVCGGWGVIEKCVFAFEKCSLIFSSVVAGFAVFAFSVALDLPRRILVLAVQGMVDTACRKMDSLYLRLTCDLFRL